MAKRKFTKAEKKQIRKEQRQKDALRSYRFRPLKNFLIWLTGMVSCLVILVSAIFVGLKFVPISTYTGGNNEEVFSKDISSKSIIDAFLKYDTYDMSDFPIITKSIKDLAESEDVKKFVKIDTSKLASLKFDANFSTELASCVEVTATLDSMGGASLLGELGNLDVFNNWDEVPLDQMPVDENNDNVIDMENEKFLSNPNLYYYKTFSNEYFRAFDNDGRRVEDSLGYKLYFPNLAQIPLLEVMNVITDRFSKVGINNLITTISGSDTFAGSAFGKILEGKTVSDFENFSEEDVFLKDFGLDEETLSLLCSIIVPENGEEIKLENLNLKHLNNEISFDRLLISEFDIDEKTLSLICSIIVPEVGEEININTLSFGHLMNNEISISNLYLVDFLKGENETQEKHYENNKALYDILCQAINLGDGEDNYYKLQISHLQENKLSFDNIKLYTILHQDETQTLDEHYNKNKMLYNVLSSAIVGDAPSDWKNLSVGHLQQGIDFNKVSLSVLELDDKTLNMLVNAVNATRQGADEEMLLKEELTIAHISSDIFSYIRLTDVMPFEAGENGNEKLYKILVQASGQILDEDGLEEQAQRLSINNLKSFNIDFVNLSTILPINENTEIYTILSNATSVSAESIKIGDLKNFKLNNITLDTFMTSSDNKIIKALIDSKCSVGELGTKINALKLYDIYGDKCFVEHDGNQETPKYSLNEQTGTYTLDDNGTFMISKKAGIWLFLCFDSGEVEVGLENSNATGCRKTYTKSTATMGDLQDPNSGAKISGKITSATIRQLVDTGILTSANKLFYTLKLSELANYQPGVND